MTWVLLIWTLVMGAWIASAVASGAGDSSSADCVRAAGQAACDDAGDVGAGIAVVLLGLLWFIGFLVLGLIWLMSRPKQEIIVIREGDAPPA